MFYLFLAAPGPTAARELALVAASRGYSPVAALRLLTVVAFLVALGFGL